MSPPTQSTPRQSATAPSRAPESTQPSSAAKTTHGHLLGPPTPTLRANPSPEVTDPFCRLPLSTLLYLPRGSSPWRPDAVIGTAWCKERGDPPREITNAPLGFHGSSRAHWTPTKARCFSRHMSPISGQSDSWAGACQQEKISPARARADVPNFVCVATFLDGRPRRRTLPTNPAPKCEIRRAAFHPLLDTARASYYQGWEY